MEDAPKRHGGRQDLVTGGLSVFTATLLAVSHFGQNGRLHADYGAEPGPALLPEILMVALAAAGFVLILRGMLSRSSRTAGTGGPNPSGHIGAANADAQGQPLWAVFVLGATIAFGVLQAAFGFGVAICGLGAVLCAALAKREGRSVPQSTVEGLIIGAVLYAIFRYALSVPLT
ncbi:MAG: tripartite tricarboxylate transporter TctB family protein [Paracoccaceae bacterium]